MPLKRFICSGLSVFLIHVFISKPDNLLFSLIMYRMKDAIILKDLSLYERTLVISVFKRNVTSKASTFPPPL